MRKAYGGQIAPLPFTQTRWYLRDLENAQHQADFGDMTLAAQLMRAARTDGVFSGVLASLTGGITKLPRKFRGNPAMAKLLDVGHDSVRSYFDEMFPPSELSLFCGDGVLLGIAVGEMRPVAGRDFPVFVRLDPEHLKYRWNENRWYYSSIVGLLPITPGDGRWVLHVPGGRIAPWQHGTWRAIARAWIPKEHARLHKDNWEGKLANPARVAKAPQGATEEQTQAFWRQVMAWGVNTVFGLKPGYDVSLLESNGRGWESYDKTADRSDRDFMIAIAGQVGTTEGGVGFSNKDLFEAVRYDIIEDVAKALAYTLNTQGLPPWIVQRWGEAGLDNPVVLEYDIARPKDRAAGAGSLATAAGAMKALREELAHHTVRDSAGEERPMALDAGEFCAEYAIPIAGDQDNDGKPEPGTAVEEPPAPTAAEPAAASVRMIATVEVVGLRAAIDLLGLAPEAAERPAPGAAPTAWRIWHAGNNPTDKGDTIFTKGAADLLMAVQAVRGNLYSIDVDHLSLSPTAPPESRKAVGWHRLEVRLDGAGQPELWAVDAQWTDTVKAGLEKDPPEWRYFSPAYDVDKKTREVTAYLNTALTNNPATWQVTALATSGAPETAMTKKEMVAALEHMASGEGGGDPKAVAVAMLAIIKSGEIPKDEPDKTEPDGDEEAKKAAAAKKAAEDEECEKAKQAAAQKAAEDEKKEEEAKRAAAIAASSNVIDLAKRVQELEADKVKQREEAEKAERETLLAGLVPEVQKAIKELPIETLRSVVPALPKIPGTVPVRASVNAQFPGVTRGEGQGNADDPTIPMCTNMSGHGPEMDRAMGVEPTDSPVKFERNVLSIRAMTRTQAQTFLATQAAAVKAQKDGVK